MYFVLDFKEIIDQKMESHDVNPEEDQTGKCHANTLEKIFNEMMAANESQNAKLNEFSRRMKQHI